MGIPSKQRELVDELSLFQDWTERYEYVIGLGKKLPKMPAEKHTENRLIKGCQSQVWLDADCENGVMRFEADSDSLITKGMIALFVRVLICSLFENPEQIAESQRLVQEWKEAHRDCGKEEVKPGARPDG